MKGLLVLAAVAATVMMSLVGLEGRAHAISIGQLEFTSGAVNWGGEHGRTLDRLFDRDGIIKLGSFQSMTEIVDPINKQCTTYSLFTSGMTGAPAPSATITGASLSVDLSSLFFGWSRGSEVHAWNIGGLAKGLFNQETSEFSLSWTHAFERGGFKGEHEWSRKGEHDRNATFFLQGKAVGLTPAPVPVPAAFLLFASGAMGVGGFAWKKRRELAA
ncbi:hypothetical protein [Nitrospira lenta]|uniref:PEP-CTERM protein-sorting domain-containing protein n=1 Tax=Nitrospira lenta TaxID=1436998 RepID=A0A330KZR4_9BACT|nr:hypothetical protein [Nitrospira lenta]SPP62995.1 exported hypothetical protein [Nitrospira lenta]